MVLRRKGGIVSDALLISNLLKKKKQKLDYPCIEEWAEQRKLTSKEILMFQPDL